jgi:hypothetical protein
MATDFIALEKELSSLYGTSVIDEPKEDTEISDPLSDTQKAIDADREAVLTGEEEEYKVETLTNKPIMSAMRRYMYDRFGEEGKQASTETDEDFYDRYMDHYRWITSNSFSLGKEIDYLRSSSSEAKQDMGLVFAHIENNAPFILNQSLGDGFETLKDNVFSILADPLNAVQAAVAGVYTGGVGSVAALSASKLAAREVIKKALTVNILGNQFSKHIVKGTVSHAALGASQGAVEEAMRQEMEMNAHLQLITDIDGNQAYVVDPEISYDERATDMGRVMEQAGFGALLGLGEGFLVGRGAKKEAINYFNNRFNRDNISAKLNTETYLVEAVTKDPVQGDVTSQLLRAVDVSTPEGKAVDDTLGAIKERLDIDREEGINLAAYYTKQELDQIGKNVDPDVVTQATLRADISMKIGNITSDIIKVKTKQYQDAAKMGLAPTDDTLMTLILDASEAGKRGDNVATDLIVDVFKYLKDRSNQGVEGVEEVDSLLEMSGRKQDFVDILTKFSDTEYEGSGLYKAVLKAFDTSMSEYGRGLQAASRVGKLLHTHGSFTKEQRKALKAVFASPDGTTQTYDALIDAYHKSGRIRRALMTITPATTARNVFSGLTNITFATGANAIESVVYHTAKMTSDKDYGFSQGLRNIALDSFGMLNNLFIDPIAGKVKNREGLNSIVDAALVNHPTLMRKLFRNNAEFGEGQSLPEMVNFLNGLNIAADGFFRRNLFAYELDKNFRRAGIKNGLRDLVVKNSKIPEAYLQKAAEETLKGTFSYSFKRNKKGEHLAATFIDFVETVPGGTIVFPFARFMTNAMAFQYQYSPLNSAMGAMNAVGTATANMFRKQEKKQKIDYAGLNKAFSRGMVGTAALYAAVKMRADQQENPYWKLRIGDTDIDTRPLFPIAPYMLVADFIVKTAGMDEDQIKATLKNGMRADAISEGGSALGIREVAEGIAGLNMRATGQLPMFDALFGLAQQDETGGYFGEDKVGTALGEFVSAYLKTPFVGTNFFKDVIASFDSTEAVIRDTKANVEGMGFEERVTSTIGESFKQILPVSAQESLGLDVAPERSFAYRQGPAYRQNTLSKQTLGTRIELPPGDVEAEMNALGMPEWQSFRPLGDRVASAYMRKAHSDHMISTIRAIMNSDYYKGISKSERSVLMNNVITDTKKEAKQIGEYFNISAIVARNEEVIPQMEEEMFNLSRKAGNIYDSTGKFVRRIDNPTKEQQQSMRKLQDLRLKYSQMNMYVYTGPFARMRWLDNVDKKTKALVNQEIKSMYEQIVAGSFEGHSEIADIIYLSAKKYGPENLTVEKTGLYGLGHELGKYFKTSYK